MARRVTTVSILAKDFAPDDPNVQKLVKGIEDGMKAEGKNVKLQITPCKAEHIPRKWACSYKAVTSLI